MCGVPGTQLPELNEAPIIQGEMVNELLLHLDMHKSMGLDKIHSVVQRELVEVLTKPLPVISHSSCLNWRHSS